MRLPAVGDAATLGARNALLFVLGLGGNLILALTARLLRTAFVQARAG